MNPYPESIQVYGLHKKENRNTLRYVDRPLTAVGPLGIELAGLRSQVLSVSWQLHESDRERLFDHYVLQ